jgi:hypothetical protein
MTFRYVVYGLNLVSDAPIRGCAERNDASSGLPTVRISHGAFPVSVRRAIEANSHSYFSSRRRTATGIPLLAIEQLGQAQWFRFRCGNGTEFVLDVAELTLWQRTPVGLVDEDTERYLLGPVLGFVLARRGITCLHASCVALGDDAIALAGESGRGKSTTAFALTRFGVEMVSDDILPLLEVPAGFDAIPGYPGIGLRPSGDGGLTVEARNSTSSRGKHFIRAGVDFRGFRAEPARLGAIYILGARSDLSEAPCIGALQSRQALYELLRNTYTSRIDRSMRHVEFSFLGKVVSRLPVRLVTPHTSLDRLDALCDSILQDFSSATSDRRLTVR